MDDRQHAPSFKERLWLVWDKCPRCLQNILRSAVLLYYKLFYSSKTFMVNGKAFHYCYHKYHSTWANERAVEIPIVHSFVSENPDKSILEIGNVLSHYFTVTHEVLDKYEKGNGIINSDIVTFNPSKKYDIVVSISTLEHIGFDETPRDPGKVLRAIDNMTSLLVPGGLMVVTVPLGYNPEIDALLNDGSIRFTAMWSLKRTSVDNSWEEVEYRDIRGMKYGHPFPCANGLIIGTVKKDKSTPGK